MSFGSASTRRLGNLVVRAGSNAEQATSLLRSFVSDVPEDDLLLDEIRQCEQTGDHLTHEIILELNQGRRRRRPFSPAEGHDLATALDDIVDFAEEAAELMRLYGIEAPMEHAERMSEVLEPAGAEVSKALSALVEDRDLTPHLVEIHRLENEGDRLHRDALAALFAGGVDPMIVIRWKDLFETLEQAIDACEDVAHRLEGIALRRGR